MVSNNKMQRLRKIVQSGLFLRDVTLTQLENLRHSLNLHDNFLFTVMWRRLIFCRRREKLMSLSRQESHVWVDYVRDNTWLVICHSTALAFVTKMSGKCQARSLSAIRVKNWRRTISTEEKLDIIIQLEKGQHHNGRLARSSIRTVHYNANRIKESAKSGTKVCIKTAFQFL
jgi:hypothetical protein